MLMTLESRKGGKVSNRLVEILKAANGEWLSRAELSKQFGRRLQPWDILMLDRLAADGIIEAREAVIGQVLTRWEYRFKQ